MTKLKAHPSLTSDQKRILRRLYNKLDEIDKKSFSMKSFFDIRGQKYIPIMTKKYYNKFFNTCGTTCCLAGLIPSVAPRDVIVSSDSGLILFEQTSRELIPNKDMWDFLFHHSWSNSLPQCKIRLRMIIEDGVAPKKYTFNSRYKERI